ncbi:hypothetical protein [Dolichospermum flos-aquae]|uniref:Uncharacterized protein n=1 Tax=Dolichospermum flos-aquae CCAP 1403/13F TaxID=315271 RepID=A0A6H2C5W1_DOLFA|nr:hypothetical protein [Dolichospermum flos-aquae]QJB47222.1 hypothetical protein HGD76_24470 [Dolichospermum flos-aquae CCAP 1403/13F]
MTKLKKNSNGSPEPNISSHIEIQQETLTAIGTMPVVNFDKELDVSDQITSIPLNSRTAKELNEETAKLIEQRRETTRGNLAMFLAKTFACSLGASYLLIALTVFNPNADKAAIKDLVSQTMTYQVPLLSFALGFYFGSNKEKE